jgi:hypothetical protein
VAAVQGMRDCRIINRGCGRRGRGNPMPLKQSGTPCYGPALWPTLERSSRTLSKKMPASAAISPEIECAFAAVMPMDTFPADA